LHLLLVNSEHLNSSSRFAKLQVELSHFLNTANKRYKIFFANEAFLSNDFTCINLLVDCYITEDLQFLYTIGALEKLTNAAYMGSYNAQLLIGRSNLVTITPTKLSPLNGLVYTKLNNQDYVRGLQAEYSWSPTAWICSSQNNDWQSQVSNGGLYDDVSCDVERSS
jgi:hypothetical protein